MLRFPALLLALAVLLFGLPGIGAPAPGAPIRFAPPVPGRVVVPFEAPDGPYGAGHRGVDLAVAPGGPVRAAAHGTVAFAGRVAGAAWVTLDHGNGVRTTYGPLDQVRVEEGFALALGAVLGTARGRHDGAASLHWGARRGPVYVDPLGLLTEPGRPWVPTLEGPGGWHVTELPDLPRYAPWDGRHRWGLFVPGSPEADGPGWSLPPNPNHAIGVAGFTSDAWSPALELTDLGYPPGQVTQLSHRGRHDGLRPDDHPRRDQLTYLEQDTLVGIERLADRLEAQLRAQQARDPGQAVDLVGHSMGGVVILHYLLTRHDPADPALPPIDHVVTIASPLEGADSANGAAGLLESAVLALALRAAGRHDEITSASARDLKVGSPLLRELAERWARANDDVWGGPLANGTDVLTIGASQDAVVPEHRSDLPGAEHVVAPGTHGGVVETEAIRHIVRAFLANEEPPGEGGGLGHVLSHPLGALERLGPGVLLGWW